MTTKQILHNRSKSTCELCKSTEHLNVYNIPPSSSDSPDDSILICSTCQTQINDPDQMDSNHWRCLNDSMWSQIPAVQVIAWRMLMRLRSEGWPQNLLDMIYLDDQTLLWAKATDESEAEDPSAQHRDSHGAILNIGDTVILTKDLNVKGAGFTAKRGTAVRSISLVPNNPAQIEGRINGQKIVILTEFVKKSA